MRPARSWARRQPADPARHLARYATNAPTARSHVNPFASPPFAGAGQGCAVRVREACASRGYLFNVGSSFARKKPTRYNLNNSDSPPMSTRSLLRTKRQRRHPASRSKSHRVDKLQGEARQRTVWVGVDAPERPSRRRCFTGLDGHEYTLDGATWSRCNGPEDFADHIEEQSDLRSWYKKKTTRNGVPVDMKRRVDAPIEVLTTTFEPALSDWTAAELVVGRNPRPKLAAIRNLWLRVVQASLAGQRYLLGYAFHADTDDLHFDLVCSRQDGKGGRIGKPGLGLVGPWCVGTDRQVRVGATISEEKRSQLHRSAANFRHRYGTDAKPLDVTFARALDEAAETVLGEALTPFRTAYAASVPAMERKHAEAQLAKLDAARNKLLQQVAPPAPEPEIPDAMPMAEPDAASPGM